MNATINDNEEKYGIMIGDTNISSQKFFKFPKITSSGDYAYNSLFEGKLGIDDKEQEKTAIYLLQKSKTEKERENKIKELFR